MKKERKFDTLCVHAGEGPDPQYGAHTTPIYQTSTFVFKDAEQAAARFAGTEQGYIYMRVAPHTPTHAAFVRRLRRLRAPRRVCRSHRAWLPSLRLRSRSCRKAIT